VSEQNSAACRTATLDDVDAIQALWKLLYDEMDAPASDWAENSKDWLAAQLGEADGSRIAVIEIDGKIVATAVGTVELGVPNPHSPKGRGVRLANVITLPEFRGRGYGSAVTHDVIDWARSLDADRIDLSATPDGQHIYEQLGFVRTSAPRMKLVL
jgi:GNAT superfamily N-acetyltransferase